MQNLVKIVNDFWELISLSLAGIGGVFAFLKKQKSSTALLYQELERLKIQVIAQVQRDIDNAKEIAEKQQIINELKAKCPDCYRKFVEEREV